MDERLRLQDFDDPVFNPFFEDALAYGADSDPYPRIAALRERGSVQKGDYRVLMDTPADLTMLDVEHYCVFGYDEVAQVLGDPATFSNLAYERNIGISFGRSISTMDVPEHPRYRRIFQKAFMPNTVAAWGDTLVDPVVNDLMDRFCRRGHADLVQEFTLHYPFNIIYRQLALPPEDVAIFHKLAIAQTLVSVDIEHGVEASTKLGAYFAQLVAQRREHPGDDLVSMLATAEVEGERLPEEVVISFLRQLVNAGGDTTYRATSVLLLGLLRNPDQLDAVRHERALVPHAIEEALRWDGPVVMQSRMAARDVTLGGVEIPAGAFIDVVAGSANRDPGRFTDPDRFDIFRTRAHRHFAFAYGPHVCIGQHLARVEMTRALNAILDRLPNLRLDPAAPAPLINGIMMRVPHTIPVVFG
ncbi:cytochrome P450 [Paraburkholderia aspalathi]|uniref:cytochrome P450 n=1 Tax=Paraburkholderia aspalathi TaxID=1324617 RepID=UPI001AFF4485|nr:cytochrome P450 [Paraburkholderia aspalathi]CAE6728130.1 Putative cytochrome P450 YjiB [Paraburkholderia aspalathi]